MKIPFDIKYRQQIESGEYKVETRDGRKARIIHWDLNCTSPIVAVMDAHIDLPGEIVDVFSVSGMAFDDLESPSDLFLVTPEEELTPFEKKVADIIDLWYEDYVQWSTPGASAHNYPDQQIKAGASELLALAIDARAKELSNGIKQSKLDKDSIPYHLMEFMCNLYTCQNWKEIEETAELYVARIKAAAMKDLPRWYESRGVYSDGWINDGFLYYKNHSIQLGSLEKLPGFKEDGHE